MNYEHLLRELRILASQREDFFIAAGREQKYITVLLFTSQIPSHPNIWILENTYNSVRRHLPFSRIIILADGGQSGSYIQSKKNVRDKGWEMIEFDGKYHQTLMLRHALLTPGIVDTPLVMVGEHDWGVRKRYIDWARIVRNLRDPYFPFKLIQLRQDSLGIWEMQRNFFGNIHDFEGLNLLATNCFQAPTHIAASDWYRNLVRDISQPNFLEREELLMPLIQTGGIKEMACYIPRGPIVSRLYHTDGRNVSNFNQLDGMWEL